MHILEMITPSRIGGAEVHVARITQTLRARGDAVDVFCPKGRPFEGYLRERGIAPLSWRTWGKIDPASLCRICGRITAGQVDIVHTHLTSATVIGSLAARLTHRPAVATVHGFTGAKWYRWSPRLIAVSMAVRAYLLAHDIPESRIRVVHPGVDTEHFVPRDREEARAACGYDPGTPLVGVFGRLSQEKGQQVALHAWPQVVARCPRARLLLVGEAKRPEIHAALVAQARELGVHDRVEFFGFAADPRLLMAACDVIVAPSLLEGLGLSPVEAMAMARPVVVSNTGGLPESVAHGTTGLLVPPNHPAELAQAIIGLLDDPTSAARMGLAGRERAVAHFSLPRQVELLREALEDAASAPRALAGNR